MLTFGEFAFNVDVCCISRKFAIHIHVSTYPKNDWVLMRFILSVVLERTVRFLTTVHVVLEEFNNCLSNKK